MATVHQPFPEEAERLGISRSEWKTLRGYLWVVSLIGLLWLFGPADSVTKPPPNLGSLPVLDGTMAVVEDRRLVMRPLRPVPGHREVTFWIRHADAQNFDMVHLRAHAALAIPTRIFYARSGSRLFALWKEDAPENSRRPPRRPQGSERPAEAAQKRS